MKKILQVLFWVKYSSAVERTLPRMCRTRKSGVAKKPTLSSTTRTIDQKPGEIRKQVPNQKQSRERNRVNKNQQKWQRKKSLWEMSFTNVKSN